MKQILQEQVLWHQTNSGKLKYGSELINLTADRTQNTDLQTRGYDDDVGKDNGISVIENGIFVNYQTTRNRQNISAIKSLMPALMLTAGLIYPFRECRMYLFSRERKNLLKIWLQILKMQFHNRRRKLGIDMYREIIFSLPVRNSGEIKMGKKGMLNDVAYQGNTVDFWNSCDSICEKLNIFSRRIFYSAKRSRSSYHL